MNNPYAPPYYTGGRSSANAGHQQQHPAQGYGMSPYDSTTYDDGGSYYPEVSVSGYPGPVETETIMAPEPGSYYPISSFDAAPVGNVVVVAGATAAGGNGGDPITALAYDDKYAAIYVATASQSISSSGRQRHGSFHHHDHHHHYNKASMLQTYDCNNGMLYASVAGHAEAPAKVLNSVYASIYGGSSNNSKQAYSSASTTTTSSRPSSRPRPQQPQQSQHIPSHAYRPPYGSVDPAMMPFMAPPPSAAAGMDSKTSKYQMGIHTLLSLGGNGGGGGGYVASVSPEAVRVHSRGGLQLADRPSSDFNYLEGLICGTAHPTTSLDAAAAAAASGTTGAMITHMTVGGVGIGSGGAFDDPEKPGSPAASKRRRPQQQQRQLVCLDIWQGLRPIASYSVTSSTTTSGPEGNNKTAVTALTTSHRNGAIYAGCSDGNVLIMDGRMRKLATVKSSHDGGVVDVAISADGTLLATTGFGSRRSSSAIKSTTMAAASPLYAFPDPMVNLFDIRYLGRGGIPHPFAGMQGGPRYIKFLPEVEGKPSNRLLVASGQGGGGLQIIVPFQQETTASTDASNFILPQLDRSCSISAMCVSEDMLALGTSQGNVLQYRLAGFDSEAASGASGTFASGVFVPSSSTASPTSMKGDTSSSSRGRLPLEKKVPLEIPPSFEPVAPPLSLEASILSSEDPNTRAGMSAKIRSVFASYILTRDATVSRLGASRDPSTASFGHLATSACIPPSRLEVSPDFKEKAAHTVDFLQTIPASALDVDLFKDNRPEKVKAKKPPLLNPNKLLYGSQYFPICYGESLNRSKKLGRRNRRDDKSNDQIEISPRYRLTLRPLHKAAASFSHAEHNETGFVPGWDYPPTMPNAFVPPVLMLLYFVPEIRSCIQQAPVFEPSLSLSPREQGLLPELGYLFHRIESISRFALLHPASNETKIGRVEAWAPSNFISYLVDMPEAEQLQILDGSPAAVDAPRRPEAFYRFLLYQIDKELSRRSSFSLLDSLGGIDFVSINEFISGSNPPSESTTRAVTVDLTYESFTGVNRESNPTPCFAEVLQRTLCRETRLRAWSQGSKSYETIVQRKIATSLPRILSLSCSCAGRKEEEGLGVWRGSMAHDDDGFWLPEMIEIELMDSGSVIVRELVRNEKEGAEEWRECKDTAALSKSVSDIVTKITSQSSPRKMRYRLQAVLSMVRDDFDRNCPKEVLAMGGDGPFGHNVLHVRITKDDKRLALTKQCQELEKFVTTESATEHVPDMQIGARTAAAKEMLRKRLELAEESLAELESSESDNESEWVMVNGFVVSNTVSEDARGFHVKFKEPSLVVFEALEDNEDKAVARQGSSTVPPDVMKTESITNGSMAPLASSQRLSMLPGKGDLIAFDAEFVSVQEEESKLTETGSKVTVRETRHALARISVIDCRTRSVIVDDHVLPPEPVVDYLTRFSGITAKDLHPKHSPHHLISTRAAYLKLRHLLERGCIFVGHGLKQDFWTVNLAVPACQIIDTVEIYNKPAQRYISLRFLTNFVLKRDMQRDVHDSVEDAMAAYELYANAVELKKNGKFDALLDDLYEYGQKTDWKIGVDAD